MKNQICKATAIGAAIAITTTDAFVATNHRTLQLPTTTSRATNFIVGPSIINTLSSSNTKHITTQLYATENDDAQDSEIERLRAQALKLRAEAASLEADKAQQLAQAAEKAFNRFDINSDGEVSLNELKAGLEKDLKVCISLLLV